MSGKELAPEAAAVAAFLSDISGFLDDEVGASSARVSVSYDSITEHAPARAIHRDGEATSQGPSSDEEARKRAIRNAKAGKRRDAYRKRLKEERTTLQGQKVALATRLEELQQRHRAHSGGKARAAWRAIAMRQLEGRHAAETQQQKLKRAVKRRRELMQDVEDTLRKRLREVEEDARGRTSRLIKKTRVQPSDDRLFEAYLDELDAVYATTDAVFESCETVPTAGPFLTSKPPMRRDGNIEYFENMGLLCVPFDYERACLALWEATRQPYRQLDREEYGGVEDTQNTIAVRFRVECRLQTGGLVSLQTHFVSRRYVEENRTVVIWRELWEGEGEFEGMHSDETGWCIVQSGGNDTGATTHGPARADGSVIRTCVRLVPMYFSANVSCHPDFDPFTEVLVTSGKEDNHQVEQMMEKMQLGDALAEVSLRGALSA
jgi:hypothetical protein